MAVAKGQSATEAVARKLYIGVGAVKILCMNPNKKQLEELYGRELDKEPEYVGKVTIDEKEYPSARVTLVCKTDPEKNNGIEATVSHTIFLQRRYRQGSKSGKYLVIDPYGRTAWATKEDIEAKRIPMYKRADGTEFPANIDPDFRPAYQGEDQLTQLLKKYLNIPNVQSYIGGEWVDNPKVAKEDCYIRLDKVDDYFKGDFSELKEILSYQPENLVKIPFGVKKTDENRMCQTTYPEMCFNNAVTDYTKLDVEVKNRKDNGGLADVEYEATELHEYVVDSSTLNPTLEQAAEAAQLGEQAPW